MMGSIAKLGYKWVTVYDDKWECEGPDLPRLVMKPNRAFRTGRYKVGKLASDGGIRRV